MNGFQDAKVAEVFNAYPINIKPKLLFLRQLIFDTAAQTTGVGALEETLKWGEPAYLTSQTKSGSTVRINWKKSQPEQYAIYFNCKTTLIETFKTLFPHDLRYEGNRAIIFNINDEVPAEVLSYCIAIALTYHHKKI